MLEILANILNAIMMPFYRLTGNWWITIFLFTVLIKIILMPMSLWVQKNSMTMLQIMPEVNRIKAKYFGDNETIGEKQTALYKEKHYHTMLSLVPLVIQIIILIGLVDVIHRITDSNTPGTEFLGAIPFEDGGLSWIMPLLAGLSAVTLAFAQNRINPLQREQSRAEKNMTNGLSIAVSIVLGVFVAAGMAFYWICSNLTTIAVQAICNLIIKPDKHIDYKDLAESRNILEEMNSLSRKKKWWKRDPLTKREKVDYKRFFDIANKHIVFYSEKSGFFKYFKGAIEYILGHSNGYIHYVTNDPNDQVFALAKQEPRLLPYYIGEKRAITLFMKLDADIMVLTTNDLDNYYLKRSYVKPDVEYVYMFHHMTSTHMVATKTAYDNYDYMLCVGPHQIEEIRRAEELYGLKKKNLIECGYDLLDCEIESYKESDTLGKDDHPKIVIAPSWQEDNICDSCIDDMLKSLLCDDWQIIVRPHPEYVKRFRQRWESLVNRYSDISSDLLIFEDDFASNSSVFEASVLITDWSSVFCEFCFTTGKPALFVNTKMKVHNREWEELGIKPTDISLRDEVGISIEREDIVPRIYDIVESMLAKRESWEKQIFDIRERFVFNLGYGGEVAGEFLLNRIYEVQDKKMAKD